jgi:3'-phosphoadenosine 5'-phosphosulfate sulfotransferase (PAPS reductase)/FAD synthetase
MNLHDFDFVVINSSAGKDSQTAMNVTIQLAKEQGFPLSRIFGSHADLGHVEWSGTKDLFHLQCEMHGIQGFVEHYIDQDQNAVDLLGYVRRRGMWPSRNQRFCTSEFKRSPGNKVITRILKQHMAQNAPVVDPADYILQKYDDVADAISHREKIQVLQIFGFRAEESPDRAKKPVMQYNERSSTGKRDVTDWHPILDWTEEQVWNDIRESGIPYHDAYNLGMPRLSCCFCIFAPRAALLIAGRANPDLLQKYVDVEQEIGHTFRDGFSIQSIQDAIAADETIDQGDLQTAWNM